MLYLINRGVWKVFMFSKRERIIKKAVKATASVFKDRSPEIVMHLYYGAVDISPSNLVVWYVFQTDADLETAKASGLCAEIEKETIGNLVSNGYPEEALKTEGKSTVCFTTQEDVDRKTDGDYRLYFQ